MVGLLKNLLEKITRMAVSAAENRRIVNCESERNLSTKCNALISQMKSYKLQVCLGSHHIL